MRKRKDESSNDLCGPLRKTDRDIPRKRQEVKGQTISVNISQGAGRTVFSGPK